MGPRRAPCRPAARRRAQRAARQAGGWLVLAAVLVAAGWSAAGAVERSARTAELEQLAAEAEVVAAYVGKDLAGLRDVTAAWSARSQLVEVLDRAGPDGTLDAAAQRDAFRLVESLKLARTGTLAAFVVDARGISRANAPRNDEALGGDFSEREWFRGAVATGAPYVTAPYRSVTAGRPWVIAAAAPVRAAPRPGPAGGGGAVPGAEQSAAGELLGVVVTTLPVAALQDFASSYRGEHGTDLAVVSTAGAPGTAAVLTGRFAVAAPVETAPVLGPDGRALPAQVPTPPPGGAHARLAGYGATPGSGAAALALDGTRFLAARAAVPGFGYAVVTSRSEAGSLAAARRLATALRTGGAALALLLLAGVAVWRRTGGARRAALAEFRRRTATLYAASPSGIVELDLEHRIVGSNQAFLRLLGLDGPEQVVGAHAPSLFHADGPRAEPEAVAELVDGRRTAYSSRRLMRHADGHPVPVQLDWGVLRDDAGQARGLLCLVTDVTQEAALRGQLERARERAEVLWRQAPVGVVEGSPDGTVLAVNASFARLLGYQPEELVGVPAARLAVPEHDAPGDEAASPLHGAGGTAERSYLHRDGSRVPVLASATQLHDEHGEVERLVGFVTDLRELHEQRAQLREALAEVARARAFSDAVLETVDVGLVYVDGSGEGLRCNGAARRMGFLPPDHAGGRAEDTEALIDFCDVDGNVVPPAEYPLVRALRGERPEPFEGRLGPRGGEQLDVVLRATRIVSPPDGDEEEDADERPGRVVGAVVAVTDVTDERRARAELDRQRRALAEAQRVGRLGSYSVDPVTGAWTISDQLYELWGHTVARPGVAELREQVLNLSPEELAGASAAAYAAGQDRYVLTLVIRHAVTGEERVLVSTTEITRGPDGRPASITGTHHDVTELTEAERAASEARAFFEAALVATPDYTSIVDVGTGASVYGTPGKELLGLTGEELQALTAEQVRALVHPADVVKTEAVGVACQSLDDGEVMSVQFRARHRDGTWRWLARRVTPFRRDDDGAVTQVLSVLRDVTELVEAQERLAHTAQHDTLTGLPNRRLLADRLAQALARSRETGRDVAVLYVDLDGFKRINDSAGHADGDAVLKVSAARIASVLRPQDTVARVGGDEFVVVVEQTSTGAGVADAGDGEAFAVEVAARVVGVVAEPIDVAGRRHGVTASVGVRCVRAGSSLDGDSAEQVLRDADAAMYAAKGRGKDGLVVFRPAVRDLETGGQLEQGAVPAPRAEPPLLDALPSGRRATSQG